jgi:hypothetical protein
MTTFQMISDNSDSPPVTNEGLFFKYEAPTLHVFFTDDGNRNFSYYVDELTIRALYDLTDDDGRRLPIRIMRDSKFVLIISTGTGSVDVEQSHVAPCDSSDRRVAVQRQRREVDQQASHTRAPQADPHLKLTYDQLYDRYQSDRAWSVTGRNSLGL